jgi:seryl-tRNA synthetase
LNGRVEAVSSELATAQQTVGALEQQRDALSQRIEALNAELGQARQAHENAQRELDAVRSDLEQARAELEDARAELDTRGAAIQTLRRIAHLELPVLVGVLPLVSYKNAEFLHNEVPGMQIPEETRERMRRTPGGEAARKEGVRIAREMLFAVRDRVQGAYLMPPLGRYELALEVLDGLAR